MDEIRGDVVTELDCWLEQWNSGYFVAAPSLETIPLVKHAREEIVALRGFKERVFADVRDEALEEAALIVERYCDSPVVIEVASAAAAKAIRALKGEGQ